jgi:hypothetical protein
MRTRLLLICGLSVLTACVGVNSSSVTPTPTATLSDPHHHVIDVNNNSLGPQNLEGFKIEEASIKPEMQADEVVVNPAQTLRAFSSCKRTCHIYFEDSSAGKVYEIQMPSFLPGRPFSSLVWVTDEVLVFDQWTQPHHGVHYAVNVREKKLVLASPFPDQLP